MLPGRPKKPRRVLVRADLYEAALEVGDEEEYDEEEC